MKQEGSGSQVAHPVVWDRALSSIGSGLEGRETKAGQQCDRTGDKQKLTWAFSVCYIVIIQSKMGLISSVNAELPPGQSTKNRCR